MALLDSFAAADELRKQGLYFESSTDQEHSTGSEASPTPRSATPPSARPRTSQACDKCRERKTKCSGERPTCVRCSGRGLICSYSSRANRTTKAKGDSPPAKRRERRTHGAEPVFSVDQGQSTGKTTKAYKPYPYPQSLNVRKLSPQSPPDRTQASYLGGSNGSLSDTQRDISRPLPDPLLASIATYNHRPIPGLSRGNGTQQYPVNLRDSMRDHDGQNWDSRGGYGMSSRSLPMSGMEGVPGDLQLGSSLSRQEPNLRPYRNTYGFNNNSLFDSFDEADDPLGGRSMAPLYNSRGQHIPSTANHAGSHRQSGGFAMSYDSSFASSTSSSSFLEYGAGSYDPASYNPAPPLSSSSWGADGSSLQACGVQQQQQQQPRQPNPQRPIGLGAYEHHTSMFDLDDTVYGDAYY